MRRTQSNRLPTVFRANHLVSSSVPSIQQTKYMPEVEAIPHCPESFQPSEEWERNTLYTFSELRLVRFLHFIFYFINSPSSL